MQIWVSPWQVAHLLSIIETIKTDIPDSLAAVGADSNPDALVSQKAGASAMRTQLRIQASLEIPLISAICSVSNSQLSYTLLTSFMGRLQIHSPYMFAIQLIHGVTSGRDSMSKCNCPFPDLQGRSYPGTQIIQLPFVLIIALQNDAFMNTVITS